jgi:maltose/moltooligosaccharide transporter
MLFVGLAWASTLTMPYSILSGALPANKMGFYMGVFNFFVVIPQIVAAAILGFFCTEVFRQPQRLCPVVGGISMIIGGLLNVVVNERKEESAAEILEDGLAEQRPI